MPNGRAGPRAEGVMPRPGPKSEAASHRCSIPTRMRIRAAACRHPPRDCSNVRGYPPGFQPWRGGRTGSQQRGAQWIASQVVTRIRAQGLADELADAMVTGDLPPGSRPMGDRDAAEAMPDRRHGGRDRETGRRLRPVRSRLGAYCEAPRFSPKPGISHRQGVSRGTTAPIGQTPREVTQVELPPPRGPAERRRS